MPGLDAKPIIDLLVEVRDIAAIDGYDATMRAAGYKALGEHGLARRRFFVLGSGTQRSLHVHVYAAGDVSCRRHLAVRDYMRAHPDACAAYAALKRRLAERFPTDAGGYVAGKDVFVLEMQSRALAWAAQRDVENCEYREQPLNHPYRHGDRILFQGDSVTDCGRDRDDPAALGYGYVMLIAAALQARAPELDLTILNRGIGGNRSRDLVARWSEDCVDLAPEWVSIMIGINDTWRRYDCNDPTTAEQFECAYRTLLQRVTAETSARIVLCEPFLLDHPADRLAWREDLNPKLAIVRRLAGEFGAMLVPLDIVFGDLRETPRPEYWAADGVHPTLAGHGLIAQTWLRMIETSGAAGETD